MMDLDREHLGKTYQLCRTGFFLLAIALIPACIDHVLHLVKWMADPAFRLWINNSPLNQWIPTLCTWGCLAGTMLLWGRWNQASWQRRSGLLLAMSAADVVLWFLGRGVGELPPVRHDWFLDSLGQALGWAEFALLASLSGDYLVHLGLEQADDSAKSTRSLAATGAMVWMLLFCEMTQWGRGWPLQRRPAGFQTFMLFLGSQLIWTITLIQVTALVVASVRHSNRVLQEMRREEQDRDVMSWPEDSPRSDLITSVQGLMATDNSPIA